MGDNIMGVHCDQPDRSGLGYVENRAHIDARSRIITGRILVALLYLIFSTTYCTAETVRVATFNVSLGRRGPGVLLKSIMSGKDAQVLAVSVIIQRVRPDILLLNEFDTDFTNLALEAFRHELSSGEGAIDYPYFYTRIGNEGAPSWLDLDGDGTPDEWADAFGFGRFPGSEGMALLSRFPIDAQAVRSFSLLKWNDLPNAILPVDAKDVAYLPENVANVFRLSSKSHWDVPVILPTGQRLNILASHPTPPVFDGPENLNGLRNDAEIGFWASYLDGMMFADDVGRQAVFGAVDFVLLGDLNNDPNDGEGRKGGIHALLTHALVVDPFQTSKGAEAASIRHGGANETHAGNPAQDTVEWDADIGNMRVDYALPSASMILEGSGVFWPAPETPDAYMIAEGRDGASNHRMVWVDLLID